MPREKECFLQTSSVGNPLKEVQNVFLNSFSCLFPENGLGLGLIYFSGITTRGKKRVLFLPHFSLNCRYSPFGRTYSVESNFNGNNFRNKVLFLGFLPEFAPLCSKWKIVIEDFFYIPKYFLVQMLS